MCVEEKKERVEHCFSGRVSSARFLRACSIAWLSPRFSSRRNGDDEDVMTCTPGVSCGAMNRSFRSCFKGKKTDLWISEPKNRIGIPSNVCDQLRLGAPHCSQSLFLVTFALLTTVFDFPLERALVSCSPTLFTERGSFRSLACSLSRTKRGQLLFCSREHIKRMVLSKIVHKFTNAREFVHFSLTEL